MIKKVYHGSSREIRNIDYLFNNNHNEFGKGFYLTFDKYLANEYATKDNKEGYLNEYQFEMDNIKIFDFIRSRNSLLPFIAFILKNKLIDIKCKEFSDYKEYLIKNYEFEYYKFDAIIGYPLDNYLSVAITDFMNNELSYEGLREVFKKSNVGEQIVFISAHALDQLTFLFASKVESTPWFMNKNNKDLKGILDYKYIKEKYKIGRYIKDIVNGGVK